MLPRNLCTKLLHNCAVGPGGGKGAHIFKISRGVTSELWKLPLEIGRETVNDLRAPTLLFLVFENLASDFPVVQD